MDNYLNHNIKNNNTADIIYEEHNFPLKKYPDNHILVIDNFFSNSLCDALIRLTNKYSIDSEKWGENTNVNCKFINVEEINDTKIREKYDKILFNYINKLINTLKDDYNIICTGDSGYCLRKINGPTRIHKDGICISLIEDRYVPKRKVRNMSIIIALNDDYDGGYFYFPHQNYKIKLKKGQLIAFPPYWTHYHGVTSLKNNTYRYTMNTWLYE